MVAITIDFQQCFIFILLWLFSCFCLSAFFFKKRIEPKLQDFNLPPSPPSLPVIGHLHLLLSVPVHKPFQNLSSKYGPLLYLRAFTSPIFLVSSGSITYEVLKIHDLNFATRTRQDPIMESSNTFWRLLEVHEEATSHKSSGV
ncbi:hypothetical protein Rs2_23407 [Raphanus sativus]|nr:hypothetical protein Rs2_23407 [Raphanus sativus]